MRLERGTFDFGGGAGGEGGGGHMINNNDKLSHDNTFTAMFSFFYFVSLTFEEKLEIMFSLLALTYRQN